MCASDVTGNLGQFVAMKVGCCVIVGQKDRKHNLCLQTRPVMFDTKLIVCARSKVNNTEFVPGFELLNVTRHMRPVTLLISLQLQF